MNSLLVGTVRSLEHRLLLRYDFIRRYDDKRFLLKKFRTIYGRQLDLRNVQTFTEKLFFRMLMISQYGDLTFTPLTDKFHVREFVRQKVGAKYLNDLLWSGQNPSEIPFDELPSRYVIKTNNGSGRNLVIRARVDRNSVVETLRAWLKNNFYWQSREYQYFKIEPRIIIEELIDDGKPDGPLDFRVWCFSGRPELIQIDNNSHSIDVFYDVDWNKLELRHRDGLHPNVVQPANFEEMLTVASKLSSEFDFVRVDLYNAYGKITFGELTFTPRGGNIKFRPNSWDAFLGRKWVMASFGRA